MSQALPETRAEAKVVKSKTYFTGLPCPHNHLAERRTHNGECVECGRARARMAARAVPKETKAERDRNYRIRNGAAISERRRAAWKENPRPNLKLQAEWNAGKGKEYKRKWTQENRDRLNDMNRAWKRANADAVKEAASRYNKQNPHIARLASHRRRARKANAEGCHTQADVQRIFKAQKGRCAACNSRRKLTVDHIVPLARGGSNWPSNLQGLCGSCNASKSAKDPIEFMRQRGALL